MATDTIYDDSLRHALHGSASCVGRTVVTQPPTRDQRCRGQGMHANYYDRTNSTPPRSKEQLTAKRGVSLGHPSVGSEPAIYGDDLGGDVCGASCAEKCHHAAHFISVGPSTHRSPLLYRLIPLLTCHWSAREQCACYLILKVVASTYHRPGKSAFMTNAHR